MAPVTDKNLWLSVIYLDRKCFEKFENFENL